MSPLPVGKLRTDYLAKLLSHLGHEEVLRKQGVILGSRVGEDAAVLDAGNPERYLVAKTDPITFATSEIGYYVVNVNANDVATRGATPRWFLSTILLPEAKTSGKLVQSIFMDIKEACEALGAVVVGGHTEITHGLDRPIVVGTMLGEVPRDRLVTTGGARPGDAIVLTKGVVIEGVSVIALEKEADLRARGIAADKIRRAQAFLHDPGLSVVPEALIAAREFDVHAMHDPTEGGLAMSLAEVAHAAGTGVRVDRDRIPVLPLAREFCSLYDLDPLRTLTSGSLLVVMAPAAAEAYVKRLAREEIPAAIIGTVTPPEQGVQIHEGDSLRPLEFNEVDEITKIF